MAVMVLEWWKNARDEEKKKRVKECMINISNLEEATKGVIEALSHKPLSEVRAEIEANKEFLGYIEEIKGQSE